ncbi:MAG: methylamine utilization protein MauJ [Pseudomonadota bacterium]
MLAKQLTTILTELCRASDVTTDSSPEMDQRFESLRGYGRLPRGRENRGRPLTDEHIAAAILGLVAARPGWSGHVATILKNLKPVGGKTETFGGAATITDALSNLLAVEASRASIIAVRLSVAEIGTNSNGIAVITYERDKTRHELVFVRDEAVSLLQPGARYDAALRNAAVSRELVFNRRFFERLAQKIAYARAYPSPPIGDGAEYDSEDAEKARRERLGTTPSSQFLNIGVDNQVTWPREETLIDFDRYKLVLMPKTKENVQSIHIDLHANRLSMEEARTVINRFLSLMTWCDDQYAIAQDGWSGNPVPVAVPKRNLAFTTTYHWIFNRDIPASEDVLRALALYREGRNAEQNFMISYAVLSYFKVLEVRYPEGKFIRRWIADKFPVIEKDKSDSGLNDLLAACGAETVEEYLWKACRVAVAHVREKHPSDPDSADEVRRLHNAAGIMRRLARYFILQELGFSDSPLGEADVIPAQSEAE